MGEYDPAGVAARTLIRRGAVTMLTDPYEFWCGNQRIQLSGLESELLALVVRRGRAPCQTVDALLLGCGGDPASRDVLLHRIRRKFAQAGMPGPIETVRGWGLTFRDDTAGHGAHIWIGELLPFQVPVPQLERIAERA